MKQKQSILLLEDDQNLGFVIKDNLEKAGYSVWLERDGNSGIQRVIESSCDICIVDVMLPKKDGFAVAESIRKIHRQIPILFLTAKSMHEDKVKGFKAGGDDYMTKPFNMEELLLRIRALLKRSSPSDQGEIIKEQFSIGNYIFDYENFQLKINDSARTLTKKEAELLKLLCLHQNQVLEREVALNIVWGNDDYFLGRSMDVFITRLRKYLKEDTNIEIQAVHGIGFRLAILSQL